MEKIMSPLETLFSYDFQNLHDLNCHSNLVSIPLFCMDVHRYTETYKETETFFRKDYYSGIFEGRKKYYLN